MFFYLRSNVSVSSTRTNEAGSSVLRDLLRAWATTCNKRSIYLFIYLYIYLFVYLCIHLSVYISIYSHIHLSIYSSNYIYISIHLSTSIYLYVYIPVQQLMPWRPGGWCGPPRGSRWTRTPGRLTTRPAINSKNRFGLWTYAAFPSAAALSVWLHTRTARGQTGRRQIWQSSEKSQHFKKKNHIKWTPSTKLERQNRNSQSIFTEYLYVKARWNAYIHTYIYTYILKEHLTCSSVSSGILLYITPAVVIRRSLQIRYSNIHSCIDN